MRRPSSIIPPEVVLEDRCCPLGCPRSDRVVTQGWDRISGRPGRFAVVACDSCGLMRTNPRPSIETIGFYYPDDYGPFVGTTVRDEQQPAEKKPRAGILRRLASRIDYRTAPLPPDMHPGRLLEVGCASGAFLHSMAERGWSVQGVEPSPSAAAAARRLGYAVHTGVLEELPLQRTPFDLIVGWMTLEHLHEPVEALRRLNEQSHGDTRLVLSVPNAASLERKVFSHRWYALQVPCHLYHFSPGSLARVLRAGGWQVDRVLQHRVLSNAIASVGNVIDDAAPGSRLATSLIRFPERGGRVHQVLYPLAFAMAALGQTGRMTVWARRVAKRPG
jgi:SAM-dependent methyltransferase